MATRLALAVDCEMAHPHLFIFEHREVRIVPIAVMRTPDIHETRSPQFFRKGLVVPHPKMVCITDYLTKVSDEASRPSSFTEDRGIHEESARLRVGAGKILLCEST